MNDRPGPYIRYLDVQRALERCRAAEPVSGKEYGLSRDASLFGDILGEMIWRKINEVPAHAVVGEHHEALVRWGVTSEEEAGNGNVQHE